jgi:hypothetical protein
MRISGVVANKFDLQLKAVATRNDWIDTRGISGGQVCGEDENEK